MIRIAGIDPSITSTGMCVIELDDLGMGDLAIGVNSIRFVGYNPVKKRCLTKDNVDITCVGTGYSSMNMPDRQNLTYSIIQKELEGVQHVAMEGYSYGSKASNSLFQIGEFCGGLRKMIYDMGIEVTTYPPSVIKKFASGNGNAKKHQMRIAFEDKYPDLYPSAFKLLKADDSPAADLVDAFWIANVLRHHLFHRWKLFLTPEVRKALNHKSTKKSQSILETESLRKTNVEALL